MSTARVTFTCGRRRFRLTVRYSDKVPPHLAELSWLTEIQTVTGAWRLLTPSEVDAYSDNEHENQAFSVFVQPRPANVEMLT